MEPIADGFIIMIAGATVTGVLLGALGGAIVWRLRRNIVLGGVLTLCMLVLVLMLGDPGGFTLLSSKLTWAAPSMILAFLLASVLARTLSQFIGLRPLWISVAAFLLSLGLGLAFLKVFKFSLRAPVFASLAVAAYLSLQALRHRKPATTACQ